MPSLRGVNILSESVSVEELKVLGKDVGVEVFCNCKANAACVRVYRTQPPCALTSTPKGCYVKLGLTHWLVSGFHPFISLLSQF